MQVQAIMKNVPMSAQKMREVVRQIQGACTRRRCRCPAIRPAVAKTLKACQRGEQHNLKAENCYEGSGTDRHQLQAVHPRHADRPIISAAAIKIT
jgi:hypothetical protein